MKKNLQQLKQSMQKADQNFYKGAAILLLFIFACNVFSLVLTQQKLVESHPELLFVNLLLLIFANQIWECSKPFDHTSQEKIKSNL